MPYNFTADSSYTKKTL